MRPNDRVTGADVDQRELVERAGRGDHDAFAVLAGASVARLEAVARLILRDHELARDAVQEACIHAWRDLPGLRDPVRFDAWFHRLTVHACYDVLRRRRRRPLEVDLTPLAPATVGDLTGRVADRDLIERAFRRLGPEQRAVVVLRFYLGMSLPAVAETLGIPLGTAQSRLHRALGILRGAIDSDARTEAAPLIRGQFV
jgi:RNA polymerase sigma-70 factor (ECF subfamily)